MESVMIFSIVATLIGVVAFVAGVVVNSADGCAGGLVIMFFSGILGFGMLCNCVGHATSTEYLRPQEVYRSKDTVFAKLDGNTFSSDKYVFYVLKDDEIWIKKVNKINAYGSEMTPYMELAIKEK